MRFCTRVIADDIAFVESPCFIKKCQRISDSHFTRRRKMPLDTLILTMLNRRGRTLAIELRDFEVLTGMEQKISKTGYLKQRMKLDPEAIKDLNKFHISNTYRNTAMKNLKGYYVIAADGTKISVPSTKETVNEYGLGANQHQKTQAVLAGISGIYDVMNNVLLSCTIARGNHNEMKEAYDQLGDLPDIIGDKMFILVLDRGYPSLPYLLKMINSGQKFVVRLSSVDYPKEQQSMASDDEQVNIQINCSRMQKHRGKSYEQELLDAGSLTLRFIKIHLDNGVIECLATNLTETEFSTEEVGRIYSMRWGIETVYDMLKNNLELGNFTGTKPILIEQDIYSCVYLCNLAQDIIIQAEEDRKKKEDNKKYKHEMAINKTYAVGVMKEGLIRAILEKDPDKKGKMFMGMISEIQSNILPVRPGRQYERITKNKNGKYYNTHKRAY